MDYAMKALTIACRYSTVRRQFGGEDGVETKIMDYKTHKLRLIPSLAHVIGANIAFYEMLMKFMQLVGDMEKAKPTDENISELIDRLKRMHGFMAGLKAHASWKALEMVEQCRQAMGGMGYSGYSGVANMLRDMAVICTWEGDNTVLTLQTGRFLLGCCRDVMGGKAVPDEVDYLRDLPGILKERVDPAKDAFRAIQVAVAFEVTKAARQVQKNMKDSSAEVAFEKTSATISMASRLHSAYHVVWSFRKKLAEMSTSSRCRPVLSDLYDLLCWSTMQTYLSAFVEAGVLGTHNVDLVQQRIDALVDQIRPQVIGVTDSFALTDYIINSPMGCADGDVYNRLFDKTRNAHPPNKPHPYFERTIRPLLESKREHVSYLSTSNRQS